MNRNVIFRGKEVSTNEWVYGDLVHLSQTEYVIVEQKQSSLEILYSADEVYKESVGMGMLFLDKNNNRIFEGDIVKSHNPIHTRNLVCTYSEEYDCFCFIDKEDFDTAYFFSKLDCSLCEVIGNEFDNKKKQ